MQLRTPKRYTSRGRKRRLISLRWWWLYLLTPIIVFIGAGLWHFRDYYSQQVGDAVATLIRSGEEQVATLQAPTPTPTESPLSYLALANAAFDRGAMDEAIANYAIAASGLPNDVSVHFRLSHLLITNGQERAGLEWADKTINADPYDPRGWAIKGMALNWNGQLEEALPFLLRALELDPDNAVTLAFLAEDYVEMGALDKAMDAAERAMELDPTDFNVQRNYGYVLQIGYGDFENAIAAYERALQLAPTQAYIAINLAKLYRFQGDFDAEFDLLNRTVEQNPESATAHFELARALWRDLGEFEQARATLERCVTFAPNNVNCLSDLGFLQRRDAEWNLCARSYDRAIQAGSTNANDYYLGGTCYIVIDECPRAIEILREGLELAETTETQANIRDAMAQCQVVITLPPQASPTPEATSVLDETADEGDG